MNVSTILYGVPRVAYGPEGCTPFPMCLRACAAYLGIPADYTRVMAESGAAFRLAWNTTCWDGGNVDAVHTFDAPERVFRLGLRALGQELRLLPRGKETAKEDFIAFIRRELDAGRPVIGLGIIGPPEACVIAGYRDGGETLLGWNVFQEYPENQSAVTFAENGYFITSRWWENPATIALMATGGAPADPFTPKEVLCNAAEALTGRVDGGIARGLAAYDAWKDALLSDREFPEGAVLPVLVERMMCHGDAMDCLSDGRHHAAKYLRRLAEGLPGQAALLKAAAQAFDEVSGLIWEGMIPLLGGWERGEHQIRRLAEKDTRLKLAAFIDRMKAADVRALRLMEQAAGGME